jgi:hypothetical protein
MRVMYHYIKKNEKKVVLQHYAQTHTHTLKPSTNLSLVD